MKIATPAADLQAPVKPKPVETSAPPPAVEPKVFEAAAAAGMMAPGKVQSSPDSSSWIPPRKITPQKTETLAPPKVGDSPPDMVPAEAAEEEREVFVL